MEKPLEKLALEFWRASTFVRRTKNYDHPGSISVLEHLYEKGPDPLARRAETLLVEMHNAKNATARQN